MTTRERYPDEIKAAAIADSHFIGVGASAARHGIPTGTLKSWRSRDNLQSIADVRKVRVRELVSASIPSMPDWVLPTGDVRTERQLAQALFSGIDRIARHYNWPSITAKEIECRLPNGTIADLILRHIDNSVTIIELKSCGGKAAKGRGWLLYQCIGQLLYYAEIVTSWLSLDRNLIRLCVVTDFDPDESFLRSLQRVDPVIQYINVLPLLR